MPHEAFAESLEPRMLLSAPAAALMVNPPLVDARLRHAVRAEVKVARIAPRLGWSMPARYGPAADANHNGLIDLPNSHAYADPAGFTLVLDGRLSQLNVPLAFTTWTVSGPTLAQPRRVTRFGLKARVDDLPQGQYTVTMTVKAVGGARASLTRAVTVRDVLVVALGDSYSSGEGNPEVGKDGDAPAKWADGVSGAMTRQNAEAHRSTAAASSQAAIALENASNKYSVTFVMLSTSGATIDNGLLGSAGGSEHSDYRVPAQLPQLKGIVGDRHIGVLTLSVGGNDIGFADRVAQLINPFSSTGSIADGVATDLGKLQTNYVRLDARLDAMFPGQIGHVVITRYPDPTSGDNGQPAALCMDIVPLLSISASRAKFARDHMLNPLNAMVESAAGPLGWQVSGPHAGDFLRHGYAASDHWFVRNSEAMKLQGPAPGTVIFSLGMLHPNAKGHRAIAATLIPVMKADVGPVG